MERSIRIGKDFNVLWSIHKVVDGERQPYELAGKELTLRYRMASGIYKEVTEWKAEGNVIAWTFRGKDQKALGSYELILTENAGKDGMVTVDTCKAFKLVAHSCEETEGSGGDIVIQDIMLESEVAFAALRGPAGPAGKDGKDGKDGEIYDDTEIKAQLTELSAKVGDIADLEKTSEEDDVIVIEDNDGNKIAEINAEGADFKNLKSNGKPVSTAEITETEHKEEEQVWMSDDESEEYAKINKDGIHSKAFFAKNKNGENVNLAKVADNVGIHLSDIYGFVGDTIQIFFNSIVENFENYIIKIDCKYGKIYPKYYECTPSVECDEPLTISVYTNNGVLLASKEVRFVATSAKNASTTKKILLIGASNVQNGEVAIEMSRRLKGTSGVASSPSPMALSNYAITGRIKNADGSVGWEGIGGWRWDEYLGSAGNPGARLYVDGVTDINVGDRFKLEGFTQEFLISEKNITNGVGYVYATFYGQGDIYKNHSLMPTDGTMTKVVGSGVASFAFSNARVESYQPLWNTDTNQWDILGYCNEHCGGAVHCICTQLGINSLGRDAFGSYSDIAEKVRLFIDRTHAQMPNCIILLGKIMLPSQMGGLGKDYTTNDQFGNYNAEGFNTKIHQYNAILESIANDDKYLSFVKVVDLCSQFDAINNYPTFEKQVNTRNPQKEVLGGNGVHPNNYGYWQVADAWIRAIINIIK